MEFSGIWNDINNKRIEYLIQCIFLVHNGDSDYLRSQPDRDHIRDLKYPLCDGWTTRPVKHFIPGHHARFTDDQSIKLIIFNIFNTINRHYV